MKFKLLSFRASREISQWEGNSSSLRSVGMTKTLNNAPSLRGSRQADAAIYLSMDYFTDARNDKKTEQGNVFFYILLAVALFAALSYAVSRNNTGSTDIFTEEQAKLAAQEIIEYGNNVANAVQKLRLRGVQDHEFDFSNNVFKLTNGTLFPLVNATCTSNTCKLFSVNGGNIEAQYAPEVSQISNLPNGIGSTPGQGNFRSNYIEGIGSSEPDLNFEVTYVNRKVCIKINEILGVDNPSNTPPVDSYSQQNYSGTLTSFPLPSGTDSIGDSITNLAGKTAFCLTNSATAPQYYVYKQVLITR